MGCLRPASLVAALLLVAPAGLSDEDSARPSANALDEYRRSPGLSMFSAMANAKVGTEEEARRAAYAWLGRSHGVLAEEKVEIAGLYRASRRAGGYAEGGKWIWDVRVMELGTMLSGVILVDAATGETFGAVPERHAAGPEPRESASSSRPDPGGSLEPLRRGRPGDSRDP